jgi:hypothetical protein
VRFGRLTIVSADEFTSVTGTRYVGLDMIDVQIDAKDPQALAELIAGTLHGHIPADPASPAAQMGKLVREQQEEAERRRPSREEIQTVNFTTIDPEEDFSDV